MLLVAYWGCLGKKDLTALVKEGSVSLRPWEGAQLKRRVIWLAMYGGTPIRLIQRSVVFWTMWSLFVPWQTNREKPCTVHVLIAQWVFQVRMYAHCVTLLLCGCPTGVLGLAVAQTFTSFGACTKGLLVWLWGSQPLWNNSLAQWPVWS